MRRIEWMDNDNLLYEISSTSLPPFGISGPQHEWFQLGTFNVPKQKLRGMSFDLPGERTFNVISGTPMLRDVRGATTLFVPGVYVTDRTLPALFKYDVADSSMWLIAKSGYPRTQPIGRSNSELSTIDAVALFHRALCMYSKTRIELL